MNLKLATLIVIIGLSISFLLMLSNISNFYYALVYSLLFLPLINFFVALYIKQK